MGCHGGRGRSGAAGRNKAPRVQYTTADKTVEVMPAQTMRTSDIKNANYKSKAREILNVEAGNNGEIIVSRARYRDTGEGSRKYPEYEYNVKGAYIYPGTDLNEYRDQRDATVVKGVNFDNVKSVKGDSYNIRTYLNNLGFKWDSQKKSLVKIANSINEKGVSAYC